MELPNGAVVRPDQSSGCSVVLGERAQHSGLRLYHPVARAPLEVEDTAAPAESRAWLRCLQQPIQLRLRSAS